MIHKDYIVLLQANNDINYDTPGIEENVYITASHLVMRLCSSVEEREAKTNEKKLKMKHTILIFLPGLYEIEQMYKKLEDLFKRELVH
jgi:HrpA-like RNA helicase